IARKAAHFTEYAILFTVLYLAGRAWLTRLSPGWLMFWCWIGCVLWAVGDEFHQIFVPGRTPAVHDVMLDSLGAFTAWLATAVWCLLRHMWSGCSEDENVDRKK